jgi:hypothetical protein
MVDDLKERLSEIKKLDIRTYQILDLTLDTARSEEEFQIQGSYIYALTFDGTDFNVRLNSKSNGLIPLRAHRSISGIYHRIFITHTAQAGKIAKLLFGVKTEFSVEDWS